MMRAVGAVMAWLLAASAAHAVVGPVVRVHVDAKAPILVGQQVKIEVQVLVPNFFMSPPRFPSLDIPGAVVTMPDESGVNLNDKIGGEDYAGIQKTYVFVAQQAGEFTLPPARITFKYAAVPGKATDGVVALPPQKITVALPAGAPAGVPAGPVARVTITQALDRGVEGLVAGDALTRTIEVFAERTPAMMIPPPRFDAPAGVRAYPRDPVLRDETVDRVGFVGGRRTDTVTYVFGTAGDFTLPAIEIAWLDPATGKQQVARAPAIQVSVAPNPGFRPDFR